MHLIDKHMFPKVNQSHVDRSGSAAPLYELTNIPDIQLLHRERWHRQADVNAATNAYAPPARIYCNLPAGRPPAIPADIAVATESGVRRAPPDSPAGANRLGDG